jgi:hypothetical protein
MFHFTAITPDSLWLLKCADKILIVHVSFISVFRSEELFDFPFHEQHELMLDHKIVGDNLSVQVKIIR